ncbi:hypothetical protein BaRGS_00011606 [Batillaria attramentaria]|uniref:Uncharacterized protein n=1 Tax=Batillaria attramentaria TaxID=370345 RepID=A0ABD0LCK3_9CAEN
MTFLTSTTSACHSRRVWVYGGDSNHTPNGGRTPGGCLTEGKQVETVYSVGREVYLHVRRLCKKTQQTPGSTEEASPSTRSSIHKHGHPPPPPTPVCRNVFLQHSPPPFPLPPPVLPIPLPPSPVSHPQLPSRVATRAAIGWFWLTPLGGTILIVVDPACCFSRHPLPPQAPPPPPCLLSRPDIYTSAPRLRVSAACGREFCVPAVRVCVHWERQALNFVLLPWAEPVKELCLLAKLFVWFLSKERLNFRDCDLETGLKF